MYERTSKNREKERSSCNFIPENNKLCQKFPKYIPYSPVIILTYPLLQMEGMLLRGKNFADEGFYLNTLQVAYTVSVDISISL